MKNRMKAAVGSVAAMLPAVFLFCHGATVGGADALVAAHNWLKSEPMIEKGISRIPVDVRTVSEGSDVSYHVVSLADGGFVVLSSDDGIEPVVAFSTEGKFSDDASNDAIRSLIARDLRVRMSLLGTAGGNVKLQAFASGAVESESPKAKWTKLLVRSDGNVKLQAFSSGKKSVSDIRVAPLVKSSWGQANDSGYSNTGSPCYNLYTPNHCPCGCVATAMAQLMRHWEYPSSVKSFSRNCEVSGASTVLSVSAGAYAWGDMPYDPSAGTTAEQREAIGKLTYDCGVAMCSSYYANQGAGAIGAFAFDPLKKCFGYANAVTYCDDGSITDDDIRQSVYPNLDAGCPVMMGFSDGGYDLHEVVADGYGFVSGTAYVHLNVGWTATSGSDLWYNLPRVTFTIAGQSASSYSIIDHVVYNVFPDVTGDILSGRVTDGDGNPVQGVEVSACKAGGKDAVARTTTSEYGVYALILPGGARYDVSAGGKKLAGVFLKKSVNPSSVDFESSMYSPGNMAFGNCWGNDFVLDGEESDPDPDPEPEPEPEPSETPEISVVCDLDGVEMVVGQSVSVPLEVSCTACQLKSIKASGLPSGLKLVTDKKNNTYAISGRPKKSSAKPFTVRLTVQAKANDSTVKMSPKVTTYSVTVSPLADWVVGTFNGMAFVEGSAAAFTMSVKATGAVSGKVTVGKKAKSFKADGLAHVSDEGCRVEVALAKSAETLSFDIQPQLFGSEDVGAVSNGTVVAAQDIWKRKSCKGMISKYVSSDKTLSWTAAGKATWNAVGASGKKVKLTAALLPVACDGERVSLCAYFVLDGKAIRLDVSYLVASPKSPECVFTEL